MLLPLFTPLGPYLSKIIYYLRSFQGGNWDVNPTNQDIASL